MPLATPLDGAVCVAAAAGGGAGTADYRVTSCADVVAAAVVVHSNRYCVEEETNTNTLHKQNGANRNPASIGSSGASA